MHEMYKRPHHILNYVSFEDSESWKQHHQLTVKLPVHLNSIEIQTVKRPYLTQYLADFGSN
jgi:hypothetical protein